MAEGVGFEPTVPCSTAVFKSVHPVSDYRNWPFTRLHETFLKHHVTGHIRNSKTAGVCRLVLFGPPEFGHISGTMVRPIRSQSFDRGGHGGHQRKGAPDVRESGAEAHRVQEGGDS